MPKPLFFSSHFVILAILMLPSLTWAQNLNITVKEKGSGLPLEGATVVIEGSDQFQTTDQAGKAEFTDVKPPLALKVLAPAFETRVVNVNDITDDIALDTAIYLTPIAFENEGLEVTAERLPDTISKIALTAEELAQSPGSQGDPIMALQSLPGVVSAEDGTGLVYLRGSGLFENTVEVNRVPIGFLYHFGGLRSTINPHLISDINLFLGGFPVQYDDVIGGAIDVRLRAPKKDKAYRHFSISTIEASFLTEGPIGEPNGRDSYFAAARRSYIDLIFSPSDFSDLVADDDDDDVQDEFITVPSYFDAQAFFRREYGDGNLDVYYFGAGDSLKVDVKEGVKADPQLAGTAVSKISTHTAGFTWQQQLNPRWYLDMPVVLFYTDSELQLGTNEETGKPFFANSKSLNFLVKPDFTYLLNNSNQLNLGVNTGYFDTPLDLNISRPPREDDVDFDFTDADKLEVKRTISGAFLAVYAQQRKHWSEKLTSIIGLRHSTISASGGIDVQGFSPRGALEYQYSPETLYTLSWGQYLQLPQGFELVKDFGNPKLEFTESEHRIIGVLHQINPIWHIKAEAYHKPMDNLVVFVDGEEPPDNYDNEGSGEAYGLDLYLKRKRQNGVMGWLSYSYGRSKRTNEITVVTRNFSGDQPHTLSFVWGEPFTASPFEWMKSWKRWAWGIKLVAHSGALYTPLLDTTPDDSNNRLLPVFGRINSKRTPAYYRLDLRLEREILHNESKAKFFLDIINLTNHENVVGFDYGEEFENIDNPKKVTGLPIFPYIGLEMTF